jgi:hypothetical protein
LLQLGEAAIITIVLFTADAADLASVRNYSEIIQPHSVYEGVLIKTKKARWTLNPIPR